MTGVDSTPAGQQGATPPPPPPRSTPPAAERTWTARRIMSVALVVIVVVFSLFNLEQTNVDFVFFDADAPLFLVIVVMLGVGFVAGYLTRGTRARRDAKSK